MSSEIGSSGTLITTVLESAGYYYQSYLLDSLSGPLSGSVGFFIYLCAALTGLVRYVLTGKSQAAVWLIIGPGVFLAVINTRTQSYGTEWRFGQNARNQAQAQYELSEFLTRQNNPNAPVGPLNVQANVSSLFVNYNRMVSELISSMIQIISFARTNLDTKFLLRAELFTQMQDPKLHDSRLRELIQGPFLRGCRDLVTAADDVLDIEKRQSRRTQATNDLTAAMTKQVELTNPAIDFLAGMRRTQPELYQIARDQGTPQVYEYTRTRSPLVNVVLGSVAEDAQYATARAQVANESFSCKQVWNFVFAGMYQYAQMVADGTLDKAAVNGVPKDEMLRDLERGKGYRLRAVTASRPGLDAGENAAELNVLARVIAQHLLQDEFRRGSIASFLNNYSRKGFEVPVLSAPSESDLSFLERTRLRASEWQEKTGLINTATTLPYYQGLALYALAIAFPFFALLLLVPGKWGGFFTWFMLWFWVKAWDVGFAVVMLLDELLFSLFSYGMSTPGGQSQDLLDPSLEATMFSLHRLDPTFQMAMYYSIIGAALAAVPVVTSYLLLGGLKGGAGLIASGTRSWSSFQGQRAASVQGQGAILTGRSEALKADLALAHSYTENAVTGNSRYDGSLLEPAYSRFRNTGVDSRSGSYQGMNPRELAGAAVGASEREAVGAGKAATGGEKTSIVGGIPSPSWLMGYSRGILNASGTYEQTLARADRELSSTMRNLDVKRVSTSAPFDLYSSLFANQHVAVSRLYGQFAVPWNAPGSFREEMEFDIAQMQQERNVFTSKSRAEANVVRGLGGGFAGVGGLAEFRNILKKNGSSANGLTRRDASANPGASRFPVNGGSISGRFGENRTDDSNHDGIDIAAPGGTAIFPTAGGAASSSGWVMFSGWVNGYGNYLVIRHDDGSLSTYGHLKEGSIRVRVGDRVDEETQIAEVGSTGRSSGNHLHFERIFRNGNGEYFFVDPLPALSGSPQAPRAYRVHEGLEVLFKDFEPQAAKWEAQRQRTLAGNQ